MLDRINKQITHQKPGLSCPGFCLLSRRNFQKMGKIISWEACARKFLALLVNMWEKERFRLEKTGIWRYNKEQHFRKRPYASESQSPGEGDYACVGGWVFLWWVLWEHAAEPGKDGYRVSILCRREWKSSRHTVADGGKRILEEYTKIVERG